MTTLPLACPVPVGRRCGKRGAAVDAWSACGDGRRWVGIQTSPADRQVGTRSPRGALSSDALPPATERRPRAAPPDTALVRCSASGGGRAGRLATTVSPPAAARGAAALAAVARHYLAEPWENRGAGGTAIRAPAATPATPTGQCHFRAPHAAVTLGQRGKCPPEDAPAATVAPGASAVVAAPTTRAGRRPAGRPPHVGGARARAPMRGRGDAHWGQR